MDSSQVKTQIQNVINQMAENALPEILVYLKKLHKQSEESLLPLKFIELTLIEDKELLEKLA